MREIPWLFTGDHEKKKKIFIYRYTSTFMGEFVVYWKVYWTILDWTQFVTAIDELPSGWDPEVVRQEQVMQWVTQARSWLDERSCVSAHPVEEFRTAFTQKGEIHHMHTLNITKLWKEKTHESTSFANFGGSGGSLFRTSLTTLKKSKQVPRFELDPDKTSIWLDE
jgi:hypothetical protein